MIQYRKGFMVFDIQVFENYLSENGEENPVFKHFIPSHIETNIVSQKITFWGYSKKFRILAKGEVIPEYECHVIDCEGGIKRVDFIEKSV